MPEEDHQVVTEQTDNKPTIDVGTLTMHVKIYAPFKVYFDGQAHSVSAVNATGPFDILPKHHNFMTLISPCDIIVRTDHGDEKVAINRGIMHVKADDVVVFLDV
jgi:F0F1-type ATP synthase epsilon subunit